MTKTKNVHVYSDPGHGWAKVARKELLKLGIENEITTCSYQRGEFAYLEEDHDLSIYIKALRANGIEPKFVEHTTDRSSKIRSYDYYRPNVRHLA